MMFMMKVLFLSVRTSCYRPQRSSEGVCLSTGGGVPDQVHPPWTRYTPPGGTPPDQVHPSSRYTPRDQVHPPGPGTPPDQVHPPGDQVHTTPRAGTHPPGTRYNPPAGTAPWTRYTPLPGQVHPPPRDQVHPPGQAHPPGPGTLLPDQVHPPGRHPPPLRDTATAADGTHPTGMHSCWLMPTPVCCAQNKSHRCVPSSDQDGHGLQILAKHLTVHKYTD